MFGFPCDDHTPLVYHVTISIPCFDPGTYAKQVKVAILIVDLPSGNLTYITYITMENHHAING
jgi:hypothetical protein